MALTAPTPPTPPAPFTRPVPPTPPKVTLDEGGSVKETTEPQSHGPQTEEELHEQQARDAVAHGSGALSKTTTGDGKEQQAKQPVQGKQEQPQQRQEKLPVQVPASGRTGQSDLRQDSPTQVYAGETGGQKAQSQQNVSMDIPKSSGDHGMLYWSAMLVVIAVLVAVILRMVMFRKDSGSRSGGRAAVEAPDPEIQPKAGMTAAEVLQEMEGRERRRRAAPPLQAAREYAVQAASKPEGKPERSPRKKNLPPLKPKTRSIRQGKQDGEEVERFEVRI